MNRMILAVIIFLMFVAGCSSPTKPSDPQYSVCDECHCGSSYKNPQYSTWTTGELSCLNAPQDY